MRFSIVTPSYRSSKWLRLCVASVADQQVAAEHIVQDAGSDDGTLEWLGQDRRVRVFVEPDRGMYDAINRGLGRAQGELLAWLNCDEQYLPGALARVGAYFDRHPGVEVVFGDVVMVNARGEYLSHRKMQTPLLYHTWTCHLSTLSCGTFFRRRLIDEEKLLFDPQLRDAGDGQWMVGLLRRGIRMAALKEFTSVFSVTGANMSAGRNARMENRALRLSAPAWARGLRPLLVWHHRLRRLFGGVYFQRPFAYEVFTLAQPDRRQAFQVSRPTCRPPR